MIIERLVKLLGGAHNIFNVCAHADAGSLEVKTYQPVHNGIVWGAGYPGLVRMDKMESDDAYCLVKLTFETPVLAVLTFELLAYHMQIIEKNIDAPNT